MEELLSFLVALVGFLGKRKERKGLPCLLEKRMAVERVRYVGGAGRRVLDAQERERLSHAFLKDCKVVCFKKVSMISSCDLGHSLY